MPGSLIGGKRAVRSLPPTRLTTGPARLLRVHPVGRLLRLARRGEDGPGVALQKLEPRCNIGGVVGARMVRKTEVGENVAGSQFRDQRLDGQGLAREASAEIAVEPVFGACRMRCFMEFGGEKALRAS
jgi:hypothetical protein